MADKEKRFVNDLLDVSLRNYTVAEPRAGLENRILAGVRARQREGRRTAWTWAVAMTGVAAMLLLVTFHRSDQPPARKPAIANIPVKQAAPALATIAPHVNLPLPSRAAHHTEVRSVDWRPQQFPTPRPLSEQEQLLLAYAQSVESSKAAVSSPAKEQPERALEIPALKIVALEIVPLSHDESNDNK